jgi:hypothetical protein
MTPSAIREHVILSIPYAGQICDEDLTEADAFRFTWRGTRFRVSSSLMVEEVGWRGFLAGSNAAILLEALLKMRRQYTS